MTTNILSYFDPTYGLHGGGAAIAHQHFVQAIKNNQKLAHVTLPWTSGKSKQPDIVHLHSVGGGALVAALYGALHNSKLVISAHMTAEDFAQSIIGSNLMTSGLKEYLRFIYNYADALITPSHYTKQLVENYPVSTPVTPITNGVDLDELENHVSLRKKYRKQYNIKGVCIFSLGYLFERKGVKTFCDVAANTEYTYRWFGPRAPKILEPKNLKKTINNSPNNVQFTGWVDKKAGGIGAGDIAFFPTKEENQCIAVLEAMACGKPVILNRIPVFEELYEHGYNCLMGSTQSDFINHINKLANNPSLRDKIGSNAQKTAKNHSIDALTNKLSDYYTKTVLSV